MNILELCLSPDLGGLELYMLRTAKALSRTDSVLPVINKNGRISSYFNETSIPFTYERSVFRHFPIFTAKRISQLIDQNNIDVIHIHWGKDLALAALSKWFSKRQPRLIYTRQMKMTRSKVDVYHNFLYRQMDCMLTITDKLADEARGFLSPSDVKKVTRLYYGVDGPTHFMDEDKGRGMRQSLGLDEGLFLVGLFGRIEREKGQYLLIDALKQAKVDAISMRGLIVGHAMKESYLKELKFHVEQLCLSQEISFKHFVDNPQDWMQICDCVVLATHEETFGLVLAEAMRAGIAVIGSNSGGVPEIIDHEKTGLLFRPGDSDDLYRCLRRLEEDPCFRARLAAAGKEKTDRLFNPETHYRALRQFMAGESGAIQRA